MGAAHLEVFTGEIIPRVATKRVGDGIKDSSNTCLRCLVATLDTPESE